MGDDSIEEDQIVYIGNDAVPGDYINGMLAMGWLPCLVVNRRGEASLFERLPDRDDPGAVIAGRTISAWWAARPERRAAVIETVRQRGLVRYL